jgi:fosfomycin resistance protein FosX
MPIQGLSHITFIVKDLERAATFFRDGLGAVEVYDSEGRNFSQSREKFFTLGGAWLAIMEGESPPQRTYRHLAFKVDDVDLEGFEVRLRAIGAEVKAPRPRIAGEGRSLYFYDFENHLFELHTGTLEERLESYASS